MESSVYVPKHFEMTDENEITRFVETNNFGVMMSAAQDGPIATHLPFLYDASNQVLVAHMAKANPHWKTLQGQQVLVVFSGPHAYISPAWYDNDESVPTWNYVAVHMVGTCQLLEDDELTKILDDLVRFHEPDSTLPQRSDELFYKRMANGIVGFRIDVSSVTGNAKLSQNKSPAVQQHVADELLKGSDAGGHTIAEWMKQNLNR